MPIVLAQLLLTDLYMSPAAAYTLLAARVHAWKWYAPLKPLMTWLRASLYAACLGVKSPPPARSGRSHHSQPLEDTDRDGDTHLLRASYAFTDLYNTDPTGSPGGARKEERPSEKVGLTSPLPVYTRERTRSRRPSRHMENIGASDKREGAARLRNCM